MSPAVSSHEPAPAQDAPTGPMQPVTRSYRAGDWFGIFGAEVTVVLPPTEKARVARIWSLVDDGAGFDEVLDALIADGLRDLPGFVLVSTVDGETKVVVRGEALARFTTAQETVEVAGRDVTTWAERSLSGVRRVHVVVAQPLGVAGQPGHVVDERHVDVDDADRRLNRLQYVHRTGTIGCGVDFVSDRLEHDL